MTDPREPVPSERAHLAVVDTPVVPGRPSSVVVHLTNVGSTPCAFTVELVGVPGPAPAVPADVPALAPGASVEVELPVQLPEGFPVSRQLIGVAATPDDGSEAVRAELHLVVSGGEGVIAELVPPLLRGRRSSRFRVALRNDGPEPVALSLVGLAPQGGLEVALPEEAIELDPGEAARVEGRVSGRATPAAHGQRLPFAVRIDGAGSPLHLEGGYTQRAIVPIGWFKGVAILTVVCLWVAALGIGLNRLTEDDDNDATEIAEGSPAPDGSDGSGGADGGAADGGGQAGGGAGGVDADGDGVLDGATPIAAVGRIGGTVDAPDPSGVTVKLAPVPLASEDTAGAEPLGFRRGASAGKLQAQTTDSKQLGATRSVTTDPTGQWAFSGLRAPAYYLVSFSKAGYGTRSNVVQVKEDGDPVVVDVLLQAGDGGVSGTVVGPDGPLGAVDITVSDGTVTLATRTPSEGDDVGAWALDGLPAPGTFLVTATRDGFGTQTALVEVEEGGDADPVSLRMAPGVGTITGSAFTTKGGVGNLTVTLQDAEGKKVREATTLTEGSVGSFTLPDLALGGEYVVSVAGVGYVTSTQQVSLAGNSDIQVPVERTTGEVTGLVREADPGDDVLANVGVTVRSDDGARFTTTSVDTGEYSLVGVPPGSYIVTFDRFGYDSTSTLINLARGQQLDLPVVEMVKRNPDLLVGTGTITGQVGDADLHRGGVENVTARVVERPDLFDVTDANGSYTITGVPAGTFTVQFDSAPNGPGYEQMRRVATPVAVGGVGSLSVELEPLADLTLLVQSNASNAATNALNLPVGGAKVQITGQSTRWVYDDATKTFSRETVQIKVPADGEPPIRITGVNTIIGGVDILRRFPTDPKTHRAQYHITVTQDGFETGTRDVSISSDTSNREAVVVDQQPILAITGLKPTASGTATPVEATDAVVEDADGNVLTPARTVGVETVYDGTSGLRDDDDVTISAPGSGQPIHVQVQNNETVARSITQLPTFESGLTGTLAWADEATANTPIPNTTLGITGVYAYNNDGTPRPAETRSVAVGANGIFTVPTGDLPITGTATIRFAATTSFRTTSATVDYASLNDADPATNPGPVLLLVEAVPRPFGGAIDAHGTDAHPIDVPSNVVQVTAAPVTQPLSRIKTLVLSDGSYQIYDPDVSEVGAPCAAAIDATKCKVRPGHYTLKFSHPDFVAEDSGGFVDGEATAFVAPGATFTGVDVSMWKYGSAVLTAEDHAATPNKVPGATFTVTGTSDVNGDAISKTVTDDAGDGIVDVPQLEPGEYCYTASRTGWQPDEDPTCFTVETDTTTTADAFRLTELGLITGTVQGRLVDTLSSIGAPVTVTATGPGTATTTFTGVADPTTGSFTIAGTAQGLFGLAPGAYKVEIKPGDTPAGFAAYVAPGTPSTPISVPVGVGPSVADGDPVATGTQPFVLVSLPATVTGHALEVVGGTVDDPATIGIDGVAVEIRVPGVATAFRTTTGPNPDDPDDHGWFRITGVPASNPGTITLRKDGYSGPQISPLNTLTRNGTVDQTEIMTSLETTVTVTVTGDHHAGTGGTPIIGGATVRAVRLDTTAAADVVGTTAVDTGQATLRLPSAGRYRLETTAPGYLVPTTFPTLTGPLATTVSQAVSLVPVRRPVKVTVASAIAGVEVPEGLEVSLTFAPDPLETQAGYSTDENGEVVIPSVLPGTYTLDVNAGHAGDRGSYTATVDVPLDTGMTEEDATTEPFTAVLQEARVSGTLTVDDDGETPVATSATVTLTFGTTTPRSVFVALEPDDDDDELQRGDFEFFVTEAGTYLLDAVVDAPAGVHDPAHQDSFDVAIGDDLDRDLSIDRAPAPTPKQAVTTTTASTTTTAPTTTTTESSTTSSTEPEPPDP